MINEALQQLRRVAQDAPEDLLHMNRVVNTRAECGTARCLLGWMIVDPWFRQHTSIGNIPETFSEPRIDFVFTVPSLHKELGITERDASNLFAMGAYQFMNPHAIRKEEVLANIDGLIAGEPAFEYDAV